jgi:hypothetical protein
VYDDDQLKADEGRIYERWLRKRRSTVSATSVSSYELVKEPLDVPDATAESIESRLQAIEAVLY